MAPDGQRVTRRSCALPPRAGFGRGRSFPLYNGCASFSIARLIQTNARVRKHPASSGIPAVTVSRPTPEHKFNGL